MDAFNKITEENATLKVVELFQYDNIHPDQILSQNIGVGFVVVRLALFWH
jgi:hypothetical protein